MARNKALNQQRLAKSKNLRAKYDLNGRKMTIKNGRVQVYESNDSRKLFNKKSKATVFEKIMDKFNHNVARESVGEGLIGKCYRRQKNSLARQRS